MEEMLQIENGIERQEAGGATPELPLVGSATKTTKAAQDIDANGDNSSSEEPAQSAPHGLNAQGEPLFLHTATTYEELEKVRNAEERLERKRLKAQRPPTAEEIAARGWHAPRELCHMMGQFRASYGHTLEFGGSCKGKWAYLFENVNTAHSLDFNYHLISTESTTILSGSFQDDPVLYGKNARRTDEMTFDFHWENIFREQEVVIEGKGKCDFYGPYLVKGRIFLDAQARRGHIRMVKLDPSQAHLLPNNNKYDLSQRENLDITVKHCLPGCCCRLHQNAATSGQKEKEEGGNKDDENSESSSSPIKMNSDSEGEEEEEF